MKQGYKQTEIGVIPEDWNISSLKDISDGRFTYGVNAPAVPYAPPLPNYIRITDISDDGYFIKENRTSVECQDSEVYTLKENDIVFARTGASTGKTYLYKKSDGTLVYAGFLIKTSIQSKKANSKYVFYCLHTQRYWDWVAVTSMRSGQPGINGNEYASFIIPCPPLPEQERIAEALSDVDNMIISLEKLIAKKKAIKQGAMQELLTGNKRLHGFSGEWYETTLGEHCDVFDGTHQTPHYTMTGIPFYSVENVTSNDFCNTKYITIEEHQKLTTKYKIEQGDILMTRIGSIGDCKYIDWDVNASFYVSLALIKCKNTIDSHFLSYYSMSEYFKKELDIRSLLTAIPQKINLGPISEIQLKIPSDINEQTAIASILSDMDIEIEALEEKLKKARQVKQGMMQKLLTGRIRLV